MALLNEHSVKSEAIFRRLDDVNSFVIRGFTHLCCFTVMERVCRGIGGLKHLTREITDSLQRDLRSPRLASAALRSGQSHRL